MQYSFNFSKSQNECELKYYLTASLLDLQVGIQFCTHLYLICLTQGLTAACLDVASQYRLHLNSELSCLNLPSGIITDICNCSMFDS